MEPPLPASLPRCPRQRHREAVLKFPCDHEIRPHLPKPSGTRKSPGHGPRGFHSLAPPVFQVPRTAQTPLPPGSRPCRGHCLPAHLQAARGWRLRPVPAAPVRPALTWAQPAQAVAHAPCLRRRPAAPGCACHRDPPVSVTHKLPSGSPALCFSGRPGLDSPAASPASV